PVSESSGGGDTGAFLRSLPRAESRAAEGPSSHPPSAWVSKPEGANRERGTVTASAPKCGPAARHAGESGPRQQPQRRPTTGALAPPHPRGHGGGLVHRSPPWLRKALSSTPARSPRERWVRTPHKSVVTAGQKTASPGPNPAATGYSGTFRGVSR